MHHFRNISSAAALNDDVSVIIMPHDFGHIESTSLRIFAPVLWTFSRASVPQSVT